MSTSYRPQLLAARCLLLHIAAFRLLLFALAPLLPTGAPIVHAHNLAGKRILIVEDEIIVALDLANKITADGAKAVGPVSTVNAALDMIANTKLDGVILDVKLRGEMAFPVADVLADRHIPFVFMTALDAGDIPSRHANVRCFQKPVRTEVICRALEAIFAAQD